MFFEFFPIIAFFIAYKISGIYVATSVAIFFSLLQVVFSWIKDKTLDRIQLLMLVIITALGTMTLLLHQPIYIKWKPTIINWLFALLFLGSNYIGKRQPLIALMLGKKISLPENVWFYMNLSWVLFFFLMGSANLYVVYHYNTNVWVNFKLFGVLGITIIFILIQALCLARYVNSKSLGSN